MTAYEILKIVCDVCVLIGRVCCVGGIICATFLSCVLIVKHEDSFGWCANRQEKMKMLLYMIVITLLIESIPKNGFADMVLLGIVAGTLLFACVADFIYCEVYQFTWWIAGGASTLLWIERIVYRKVWDTGTGMGGTVDILSLLIPLVCFVVLQETFFVRMYGRADCHAFGICAVAECAFGMDIRCYFLHMTLAFSLLIVVQSLRRNIGSGGRLKQPVAFLPYITISFWTLIALYIYTNIVAFP